MKRLKENCSWNGRKTVIGGSRRAYLQSVSEKERYLTAGKSFVGGHKASNKTVQRDITTNECDDTRRLLRKGVVEVSKERVNLFREVDW